MNKSMWKSYVSANNNGDFISIKAYSGYSLPLADPEAPEYLLAPDASDEILGQAVTDALKQSRFLPYEEAYALEVDYQQRYLDWIRKLMDHYGYKTKGALFKKMKSCGVDCDGNVITIRPSHHDRFESWTGDGIDPEKYVKIAADSPPAEIGAALRLAFSRCTGLGTFEY